MKRLEKILVQIISTFLILYAAIVLLFSLPFMQKNLAGWVAGALSDQLKSKVEIGSINLGLLNRVIINDVVIYEPSGKQMASIARMSANVSPSLLLTGKIDIGTAQLFSVKAKLYRQTPESEPNYQFLVDAFKSEEKEEPTEINLSIGSLLMRHADISYDVLSEKKKDGLDFNHLDLKEGGMNLVLRCLTGDSINASVRHFHAKERNSGFVVSNAQLFLEGNKQSATLSSIELSLPHSEVSVDTINVNYENWQEKKQFSFTSTPISGHITPYDLKALQPNVATLTTPIFFNITASGDEKEMGIGLRSNSNDYAMALNGFFRLYNVLDKKTFHFNTNIETLHIDEAYMQELADAFIEKQEENSLIAKVKEIDYKGNVGKDADGTLSSDGTISTAIGNADYDLTLFPEKLLTGTIVGDSINIGALLDD